MTSAGLWPLVEWGEYCHSADLPERRILAHPGGASKREDADNAPGRDTVLAVGPEGGFTDEEISLARAAGWRVLDLGPRILRIETAAIALAVLFELTSRERYGVSVIAGMFTLSLSGKVMLCTVLPLSRAKR